MSSRFVLRSNFQQIPRRWFQRKKWKSYANFAFYSELLGFAFFIPRGTVSDLASIPWFLRWRYPPDGDYKWAAFGHDWAYGNNGRMLAIFSSDLHEILQAIKDRSFEVVQIDKRLADLAFMEMMEADGIDKKTRNRFYKAVDVFGDFDDAKLGQKFLNRRLRRKR